MVKGRVEVNEVIVKDSIQLNDYTTLTNEMHRL